MQTELIGQIKGDMEWLFDTHLKPFQQFKGEALSAEITGNMDCPQSIKLHYSANPSIYDEPLASFTLQNDLSYQIFKAS